MRFISDSGYAVAAMEAKQGFSQKQIAVEAIITGLKRHDLTIVSFLHWLPSSDIFLSHIVNLIFNKG